MQRWVIVKDGEVLGYLLYPPVLSENDEDLLIDAMRKRVFGDDDDGTQSLEERGTWYRIEDPTLLVGDGWRFDGENFTPRNQG